MKLFVPNTISAMLYDCMDLGTSYSCKNTLGCAESGPKRESSRLKMQTCVIKLPSPPSKCPHSHIFEYARYRNFFTQSFRRSEKELHNCTQTQTVSHFQTCTLFIEKNAHTITNLLNSFISCSSNHLIFSSYKILSNNSFIYMFTNT